MNYLPKISIFSENNIWFRIILKTVKKSFTMWLQLYILQSLSTKSVFNLIILNKNEYLKLSQNKKLEKWYSKNSSKAYWFTSLVLGQVLNCLRFQLHEKLVSAASHFGVDIWENLYLSIFMHILGYFPYNNKYKIKYWSSWEKITRLIFALNLSTYKVLRSTMI